MCVNNSLANINNPVSDTVLYRENNSQQLLLDSIFPPVFHILHTRVSFIIRSQTVSALIFSIYFHFLSFCYSLFYFPLSILFFVSSRNLFICLVPFCDCLYCFIQRIVIFSWAFSSFLRLQSLWMSTKDCAQRKWAEIFLSKEHWFICRSPKITDFCTFTLNINSNIRCHKWQHLSILYFNIYNASLTLRQGKYKNGKRKWKWKRNQFNRIVQLNKQSQLTITDLNSNKLLKIKLRRSFIK